jgi:predicted Zn-dependent protease
VARRRLELVAAGVLRTPAVGPELAGTRGLAATPHAIGLDDARAEHLFLAPAGAGDDDLARAADGGLWIGELFAPHVAEPGGRRFRAIARNVRRLTAGAPADALPDLVWEADLSRVFDRVLAIGGDPVPLATAAGWGATCTPSLALPPAGTIRPPAA